MSNQLESFPLEIDPGVVCEHLVDIVITLGHCHQEVASFWNAEHSSSSVNYPVDVGGIAPRISIGPLFITQRRTPHAVPDLKSLKARLL